MLIADLHIHSRFSRATSKEGTPEQLDLWARRKGIDLVGTGDFTHPAWREELRDRLVEDGDGLYRLRDGLALSDPAASGPRPRFVISGEISSIYKKDGRTRKVHNVILLPSLEAAETLSRKLEAIGNIRSDGRPILGLDSRDLLEITLESCPEAIFIPAHIWTPHFSLFGAYSGFDTIEACFGDLTGHIHALETGLSSDPPMNWRLSALDGYTLVSNSDAHSPAKLGREANLLDIEPGYTALKEAIEGRGGFAGTIEFFPEEGKYHYDGHRGCKLCLRPEEAIALDGLCPVCGKKLTIGVQHRVEQLADRQEGCRPDGALPFESLAPLCEVVAASTGASPTGTKVQAQVDAMLRKLGPEFAILRQTPLEDVERAAGPCVAEGLRRLRLGQVKRRPGYDGEYGVITLLERSEIDALTGQISLFGADAPAIAKKKRRKAAPAAPAEQLSLDWEPAPPKEQGALAGLNAGQREAACAAEPAVAVVAGPGTGKTKTLVARVGYLLEQGVKAGEITAVTFTNRAAGEMRARLEAVYGKRRLRGMSIGTFHAICLSLLEEQGPVALMDQAQAAALAQEALGDCGVKRPARALLQEISRQKSGAPGGEDPALAPACQLYLRRQRELSALDFDDLLLSALELCRRQKPGKGFAHLLIDEFQDMSPVQYQLAQAWSQGGKSLFVIGDPDQAIYGFRGADARCFDRLGQDAPGLRTLYLRDNYRSTPEILGCALPVIARNPGPERVLAPQRSSGIKARLMSADSDLSQGIFVAKEIGRMVGGMDMLDAHGGAGRGDRELTRSFSDLAVLYRTHRQADLLGKCLQKEGIPYVVAGRDDFLTDPAVRGSVCFFRFLLDGSDLLSLDTCLRTIWDCPPDLAGGVIRAMEQAGGSQGGALPQAVLDEYGQLPQLRRWVAETCRFAPRAAKEKPRKLLEDWAEAQGLSALEPVKRLLETAVFHGDMPSFLHNLLLGQEGDLMRCAGKLYASGAVTLMTLHGSKGLEFPVVFLCGASEGVIPLETAGHPADWEEERRLFYVGMTRAKDELILLTGPQPSPFLADIPSKALARGQANPRRRGDQGKQLTLFE